MRKTCGKGLFYRNYRPLLQETGWLVSDFISVCLETRWLGQKKWFLCPGSTLYGVCSMSHSSCRDPYMPRSQGLRTQVHDNTATKECFSLTSTNHSAGCRGRRAGPQNGERTSQVRPHPHLFEEISVCEHVCVFLISSDRALLYCSIGTLPFHGATRSYYKYSGRLVTSSRKRCRNRDFVFTLHRTKNDV